MNIYNMLDFMSDEIKNEKMIIIMFYKNIWETRHT